MISFVIVSDARGDSDGILDGGLLHGHGLEPALQSRILLDVLSILCKGGGADDLDVAPAQGGLQDVGGVHAALRVPRTYDGVDLIDEQDDVPQDLDLVQEALHAALHLAPVLGPGHKGGHIELPYLLVEELIGGVPPGDLLGQPLHDGGLAHAGLADQTGVVLQPPVQYLHGPLQLRLPADEPVQLPGLGLGGQVDAEGVEILLLLVLSALTGLPIGTGGAGLFLCGGLALLQSVREQVPVQTAQDVVRAGLADVAVVLVHVHELAAQKLVGLFADGVQVLLLEAEVVEHVVDGLHAQLLGAFQTIAFALHFPILHAGYEEDGLVFFASYTKRRHLAPPKLSLVVVIWFPTSAD